MRTLALSVLLLAIPAVAAATPPQPPLTIELAGPGQVTAGDLIELRLRITRTRLLAGELRVLVELPPGVELVSGAAAETIVDASSSELVRTYRLRCGAIPLDDVRVEVVQRGEGYGVAARDAYRFGRPPPIVPGPRPDGDPVEVRGFQLGRTVTVTTAR